MPRLQTLAAVAMTALTILAVPAAARPVTDCPLRDAPFSAQSPLIDLLLSDAAKAVLARHGSKMDIPNAPKGFLGTKAPTFAAILTLQAAARFTGMPESDITAADAELRKLPVTAADKVARCERYDNDVPVFKLAKGKPHILLFEKINGFKDTPSVNAAHAAFVAMAERNGWDLVATEKGGAFNPATLAKFDAVVWNNISGDVLTLSQRKAFQDYLTRGGAFAGVHGTAGDPVYFWDWFADTLIGARFLAHPMSPQFQEARVVVDKAHPLAASLPADWRMTEEWYSFKTNPRKVGAKVLLTLDEGTYSPVGPMGIDLKMGDHPMAWTNCIGKGRMFYSAIGHRPENYSQPQAAAAMEAGLKWAVLDRKACAARH